MLDKVDKILMNSDDHHTVGRVVYVKFGEMTEDPYPSQDGDIAAAAYLYLDKECTMRASAEEMEELFLKKCFIKQGTDDNYGYMQPDIFSFMSEGGPENTVLARMSVPSRIGSVVFYNKEFNLDFNPR